MQVLGHYGEHNKPNKLSYNVGTERVVAEVHWGGNVKRKEEPLLIKEQAHISVSTGYSASPGAHSPGMYPLC